jgi:hypothetical protein
MPTITLLTSAIPDNLSADDYRAIYDELRARCSLRAFVAELASIYSIAWWSKYEHGAIELTLPAMRELRRAVALPDLPPTIPEITADPTLVSPSAAVYSITPPKVGGLGGPGWPGGPGGPSSASRIILIAEHLPTIDIHVNSDIALAPSLESHVTSVTCPTRRAPRKSLHLSPTTWQRLNSARLAHSQTWEQFLAALLDH